MKLKPIIYSVLVLVLLAAPVLAADFKMPTFTEAWATLDAGIQGKMLWVIGMAFIILVIAAIVGTMFGGTKATLATITGNVGSRSEGVSAVLITIGVVFLAILVIGMLLWIAG